MSIREFTVEEVAKHNKPNDCWLIIDGYVYDVTSFLAEHPAGRQVIMLHAGKDATEAYLDVHSMSYLTYFLSGKHFLGEIKGATHSKPRPKVLPPSATPPTHDEKTILSLPRTIFKPEHDEYRAKFREFIKKEIIPNYAKYEARGQLDQDLMRKCSAAGFYVRQNIPKEFGGLGITDWRYNAIVAEELEHLDCGGCFLNLGNDMVLTYFLQATPEQRARWLPKIANEHKILAVAMSEPELGSDLGTLGATAVKSPDGKHYILNGRKMWISNGAICDYLVVAAVTDPAKKYRGISLFVVERGMKGFSTAKRFAKIGKHAQDTCLMTLKNVQVPVENLLGVEGNGFIAMMNNLPKERLSVAVGSIAGCRRTLALTTNYVHRREAFGATIGSLQSVQLRLAKLRVEVQSATSFIDQCILAAAEGKITTEMASMAKYHATELASQVADSCLQLFGGYGYLKNNPVAKQLGDARGPRIYAGSNEVMLEIIAKGLGFKPQRFTASKL